MVSTPSTKAISTIALLLMVPRPLLFLGRSLTTAPLAPSLTTLLTPLLSQAVLVPTQSKHSPTLVK